MAIQLSSPVTIEFHIELYESLLVVFSGFLKKIIFPLIDEVSGEMLALIPLVITPNFFYEIVVDVMNEHGHRVIIIKLCDLRDNLVFLSFLQLFFNQCVIFACNELIH